MKSFFFAFFCLIAFVPALALAKTPDDPEVKQWAFEHVKAFEAWDYFVGSKSVVVAVIDNGFDTFHPDLFDNVWQNEKEIPRNGVDDDNNGYVDDVWGWNFVPEDIDNDGKIDEQEVKGNNNPRPGVDRMSENEKADGIFNHATLVAGLIGAAGNNNLGLAGVNWKVRLMNIKIINSNGEGDLNSLPLAIHYAVDNGAQIINISLVGTGSEEEISSLKTAVKYAYDKGVAIFAAAGNDLIFLSASPLYPVCIDKEEKEQWLFGVSAIVEDHHLAMFSNTGAGCIDITAPGVNVTSTVRYSPTNGLTKMVSGGWRGTSFATPLVSGAAALLKGINPQWQAKEIYQALTSTVHHTPGQDETIYAQLFGAGLLQIDKAVKYALEKTAREERLLIVDKKTEKGIIKNLRTGGEETVPASVLSGIESLTVRKNNNQIDFVAVKKEKNKKIASFYDALWGFQKSEPADAVVSSSSADSSLISDIDGDGEEELIKTGGPGSESYIEIFSRSGQLKRKFLAFDANSRFSLALALLDYDGDGRKDIAVFAKNSGQPLRIWNYKVKKIFEWLPPVKFGAETEIFGY